VRLSDSPDNSHGSPASEYELLMTCPDRQTASEVYRGPKTQSLITGLQPGRTYAFQVRALNHAGVSFYHDVSSVGLFLVLLHCRLFCSHSQKHFVSYIIGASILDSLINTVATVCIDNRSVVSVSSILHSFLCNSCTRNALLFFKY